MRTWYTKTRGFFREVWEEFAKCTRPSKAELQESTLIVVVTMAVLGIFIFISDILIKQLFDLIFNIRL